MFTGSMLECTSLLETQKLQMSREHHRDLEQIIGGYEARIKGLEQGKKISEQIVAGYEARIRELESDKNTSDQYSCQDPNGSIEIFHTHEAFNGPSSKFTSNDDLSNVHIPMIVVKITGSKCCWNIYPRPNFQGLYLQLKGGNGPRGSHQYLPFRIKTLLESRDFPRSQIFSSLKSVYCD